MTLTDQLRALGEVRAPATLLPGVLERVAPGDRYATLETPLGPAFVAFNHDGVSAVRLAEDEDAFAASYRREHGRPVRRVDAVPPPLARRLERALAEGDGRSLRYDLRGLTEFERAVLRKVLEIPRGEVRTYAWVAREIGRPAAVRAVGSALGHNPVPILIPCHRVVRSDGRVGDYALGGRAKRTILGAEGVAVRPSGHVGPSGARYLGSDTTKVYCFPTCRNARRIAPRHRVPFRDERAAAAAGYRPCRVCRPALTPTLSQGERERP
jgi:O-6-methylguanine DNA methyltransferase